MVHIYNAILLSHKKKQHWVICSDVDELTEVSQKESKKILDINTYVQNLEKWYWWTYLQSKIRDANIENDLVNTKGDGEGGKNGKSSTDIYTTMCKIDS